ncbi:MAG: mitochondrial Homoaconitase [Bogoriella megaspora]|nr:MAG: mitochondrial Homoaconitase [Bogoriella megaspora]
MQIFRNCFQSIHTGICLRGTQYSAPPYSRATRSLPGIRYGSSAPSATKRRGFGRTVIFTITTGAIAGISIRIYLTSKDGDALWDKPTVLDPHAFRKFELFKKEQISSTSSIFHLRPTQGSFDAKYLEELWNRGIWSVEVKQPQLQIVRAYTPLPPSLDMDKGQELDTSNEIRLLIRREENGEVSGFLHRLPVGSTVEVRRANVEYELPPGTTEVLFLAGGTGIAPALQLAYATLRRPESRIRILWANRRREDCIGGVSEPFETTRLGSWPWLFRFQNRTLSDHQGRVAQQGEMNAIVKQLYNYQKLSKDNHGQLIDIECFVDEEKSFINTQRVIGHLQSSSSNEGRNEQLQRRILVSGPDGFVEHWSGKKPFEGAPDTQGRLGGVLSQLDTSGWKIWKL